MEICSGRILQPLTVLSFPVDVEQKHWNPSALQVWKRSYGTHCHHRFTPPGRCCCRRCCLRCCCCCILVPRSMRYGSKTRFTVAEHAGLADAAGEKWKSFPSVVDGLCVGIALFW